MGEGDIATRAVRSALHFLRKGGGVVNISLRCVSDSSRARDGNLVLIYIQYKYSVLHAFISTLGIALVFILYLLQFSIWTGNLEIAATAPYRRATSYL